MHRPNTPKQNTLATFQLETPRSVLAPPGQRAAERLIEQGADEEGRQADGHRGGIEVIALVHLRRVGQPGGQAEADEQADGDGQQDALASRKPTTSAWG